MPFSFLFVFSPPLNYLLGTYSLIPQIQYPGKYLAKRPEKLSDLEVKRELGKGLLSFIFQVQSVTSGFLKMVPPLSPSPRWPTY